MQFKGKVRLDSRTKELCKRINAMETPSSIIKTLMRWRRHWCSGKSGSHQSLSVHVRQGTESGQTCFCRLRSRPGQARFRTARGRRGGRGRRRWYKQDREIGRGRELSLENVKEMMKRTEDSMSGVLKQFVENTIEWVRTEIDALGQVAFPELKTMLDQRHCLIVVRGANYRDDLEAIASYIREVKPVLIGVDGGADALVELGYRPDIVVGDMDSVSDKSLALAPELVVHAYPDGRAPGMERVRKLGLEAHAVSSPGTSEDVAMLMAYEKGAELIVAVGTHSNVVDFLEKGRKGMSSTFLVRLRVGTRLVDARGVSKLYRTSVTPIRLLSLVAAALLPMALVFRLSTWLGQLVELLIIRIRVLWRML